MALYLSRFSSNELLDGICSPEVENHCTLNHHKNSNAEVLARPPAPQRARRLQRGNARLPAAVIANKPSDSASNPKGLPTTSERTMHPQRRTSPPIAATARLHPEAALSPPHALNRAAKNGDELDLRRPLMVGAGQCGQPYMPSNG